MPKPNNNDNANDLFRRIIVFFKEGYHSSARIFIWGKAFKEWGRFGVGAAALLMVCLVFFSVFLDIHQKHDVVNNAALNVSSQINETTRFIDLGKRSLEKREEILKGLMQVVNTPTNQALDQKAIEQNLNIIFSLLENCKKERRTFVRALSEARDPSLNPEISEYFATLIAENKRLSLTDDQLEVITLQEESTHWRNLCSLCQNEMKRTQAILLKRSI